MAKYKAYPEYKDSGVESLDTIPKMWSIKKLKYIFEIKKRIAGKIGFDVLSVTQKGIKIKDIESGEGQLSMDYSKYQRVYPGEFAMNHMDLLTGYVDISNYDGVTSPDYRVFAVRDKNIFYSRYYLYLLQDGYKQRRFFHLGQGSAHLGRWRLPTEAFNEIVYPCPSLKEQNQIASFLDHETTKIDNLIEKQQQLIELLKEKRQAVISHAVTKGLNPDVPMKDSGVEWLGEVPEHWDVAKLSFKYEVLLGKMLDDKKITGKYLGRYLRNTDVQWDSINTEELPLMDFRPEERERFSVKKGDLVVCEGGDIGRSAIWNSDEPCFYQKALHRLRPLSNNNKTRFMFYVLYDAVKQGRFISGAGKATIAHLPAESFRQYKFGFPPLTEQVDIATTLDSYSQLFDKLEEKTVQQIALLQERRTALISAAVTGKIDVRDWVAPETQDVEESQEATA